MPTRSSRRARGGALALALVLGGCATAPEVTRELGTSTREARLALELADERGPVRGRVIGLGATTGRDVEARVLDVMGEAVRALSVRFTADAAEPRPVLVVSHGLTPGADPCADSPALTGDPLRVVAAFCDDGGAIGAVVATLDEPSDEARTRLYRRLARELFPDLYEERYGFGRPPFNVYLGATFGL
ncbi:MAG: hypothetical protein ACLFTG_14725 [Alphaproteobacteria bacterium]